MSFQTGDGRPQSFNRCHEMRQDAKQLHDERASPFPIGVGKFQNALQEVVTVGRSAFCLTNRRLSKQAVDLALAENVAQLFQHFLQRTMWFHAEAPFSRGPSL
jgi:hypothetical protein